MALCSALGETWLVVPQMSWTSIFRPAAGALNAASAVTTKTIKEHKIVEATVKVSRLLYSRVLFPLTPALSLRERENQGPRCGNSKWVGSSKTLLMMLPLPEGEGRGEGEPALESADSRSFAIGSVISALFEVISKFIFSGVRQPDKGSPGREIVISKRAWVSHRHFVGRTL